jgi:hypothetical protein
VAESARTTALRSLFLVSVTISAGIFRTGISVTATENGWIAVRRNLEGEWRLHWEPGEGHPEFPGVTLSRSGRIFPKDFPRTHDPADLLARGEEGLGKLLKTRFRMSALTQCSSRGLGLASSRCVAWLD